MKEKKIAWLVTHDAYIDRRILFFADVLMENGYSVKLFPSAYTDFTNDSDPDYVVRPLDWNVVKLYALSLDALMEEERGLITHVIDAQEAYHRENGTYACALELLAGGATRCKRWESAAAISSPSREGTAFWSMTVIPATPLLSRTSGQARRQASMSGPLWERT